MPGLSEYVRVFTAVEIDEDLRRAIHSEGHGLLEGLGKFTPVREENLHVTLKFVGNVHRGELALLSETVADCARALRPGSLDLRGAGVFPDFGRPRVVWAGVSDPGGILSTVFDRLNDEVTAFGAKREVRRYAPHVTLARVRGSFDGLALEERIRRAGGLYYTPSESPRRSHMSRERAPEAPAAAGGEEGEVAQRAALRGPPRLCRGSGLRGSTRSAHAGEDLPPPLSRQRGRGPSRTRLRAVPALWYGSQAVSAVTLFMSEIERGETPRYTVLGHYGAARQEKQHGEGRGPETTSG
jgi:2'-5' RNA ligase